MKERRTAGWRARVALVGLAASACTSTGGPLRPRTPAPVTPASLRASIDSMMALPGFRNAHWGILIVDPARGDTLYSRNAGKLFMPASNMKIITGAIALATLGPEYRYRTVFASTGPIRDGVLTGDMMIFGQGDPSLSDRMRGEAMLPFREIADSLAVRGVRRITGDVRAAGDAFSDEIYGFGWSWDDFDAPYSAAVDELMFNEGFWRLTVVGGALAGDSVTVLGHGPGVPAFAVRVTTIDSIAAPGDSVRPRTRARLVREPDGTLTVTGVVLTGDTTSVTIAQRDPIAAYLEALRAALIERGIVFGAAPAAADTAAPLEAWSMESQELDTLFTVQSPPLREILPALEKPSQNQIAEIFLKTLGLELAGAGRADSGRAVVERKLEEWGIDRSGFAVRDGSGLSRHNYLSPETIVRVLDRMRSDTAFAVFYESLPIAGVDGTIGSRMRGTPAEGNLRAKTGTIDKARALSGYVTTADGHVLIFSTLANNFTVPLREVDSVQNTIGAMLASMRLRR